MLGIGTDCNNPECKNPLCTCDPCNFSEENLCECCDEQESS